MDESELVVGAFYWAIPANDPDIVYRWEYHCQPVRFWGRNEAGDAMWQCIGMRDVSEWPMRWIGPRLISPFGDEDERMTKGNKCEPTL
jgi:hypothetical protein